MKATRRYERRWRLPPPYLRESEPMEGAEILDEFGGATGLLLWQSVRDAVLWALTPPDQREGIFTREAEPRRLADMLTAGGLPGVIEEPMRALAAMLSHPADVAPEAIMLACNRVSQWAEAQGAIATALAYAQSSALAMPASARSALRVGRLARRKAEYARAEGWLQRAVVLARQERDRVTHAFGYSALGNLYRMRGNMPAAERHHLRALRIATRHSLAAREAAALHDLFVMCAETCRYEEAVAYAGRAVAAYGPRHEQVPTIAHDVAVMWVESGHFARALPVLRVVWPRMAPGQRVLGVSNAARAAGASGDAISYDDYRARTLQMVDAAQARENHPVALLNLARGATGLGELDLAETFATRARDLAHEIGEHKIHFNAVGLLQAIASDRAAIAPAPVAEREPIGSAEYEASADALAGDLLACLAG